MVYTILLYQIDPKIQDLLYDLTEFRSFMYNVYICVFYFIIVLFYVFYSNNVLPYMYIKRGPQGRIAFG